MENSNQNKLVTPMKSQAKDNITPEESQRRETQPHYHHHQQNHKKKQELEITDLNIS